jgi:hypothetical protein
MGSMESWLTFELSLAAEAEQEMARRRAAHMSRDELSAYVDHLIVAWYRDHHLFKKAMGRVIELEAREALSAPAPRHLQWARDLLAR